MSEPRERAGGTLFVVATPIGNLADVTLRALEILRSVPLVAAEDTRLTRRLLDRYEIRVRLVSYHARSAPTRQLELLAHLRSGEDLAVVTDAGTPGVSDPGDALVRAWADEGGRVEPIPGASAVLAAVAASGIAGPRWTFEGFLPRAGRERRERLGRLAADERGAVLFEAPQRVAATLADLADACGADRAAAVCRELTKRFETIERGSLGALAERAASGEIRALGEFVLVLGHGVGEGSTRGGAGPGAGEGSAPDPLAAALAEVERLVAAGTPRGEAARAVAARTGLPRRSLYRVPGA